MLVRRAHCHLPPGAWLIHPVLICCGKLLIDAIPGMTQDVSWTIVNLSYITVGRHPFWTRYDRVCLQKISSPSSCSTTSPDFLLNLP